MKSPYIFKFSALIAIRRDREEQESPSKHLGSLDLVRIPGLFLTRQEHYYRHREELRKKS